MISAIILTHNDEPSIAATLKSVQWCDEIIVVDDFSIDTTTEVAKIYTQNIFQHRLNDDFAAQRNFALSKAKGDWVLFIDSDEVVSEDLAKEIRESLKIDCAGFYIKRLDWIFGNKLTHGETGNLWLLRLAKKNAGIWKRPVHEVWHVTGITGKLSHTLDHFPHQDVAQFINDINYYSTLNARHLYSKNIRVSGGQLLTYPMAKFFINYIRRLGFLDGIAGAVVALIMSFHSFLTRAKLWMLWQKAEK